MKIYTKTGDTGQTSLASMQRVSKADPRIEAYGTSDELNSFVGLLRAQLQHDIPANALMDNQLEWIQNKLFNLGAALAEAEGEWINKDDIAQIEQWIDQMQADLPILHDFILPAGNEVMCTTHICRTVTRRLERDIVRLTVDNAQCTKHDVLLQFVNRLSDFWFVFAKKCGKNAGNELFFWKK